MGAGTLLTRPAHRVVPGIRRRLIADSAQDNSGQRVWTRLIAESAWLGGGTLLTKLASSAPLRPGVPRARMSKCASGDSSTCGSARPCFKTPRRRYCEVGLK
eukprot:2555995-Rhodomonas_salina.1